VTEEEDAKLMELAQVSSLGEEDSKAIINISMALMKPLN
jgi:hypothetical protein